MKWIYLIIAIITEVIATSALKESQGFSKVFPSIIVVVGYSLTFYFMSLTLKEMSVGITYAIWSGMGILLKRQLRKILMKSVQHLFLENIKM